MTSTKNADIKLLIRSQTSTIQPLKLCNGYVILSDIPWWMLLVIHAEIDIIPCR